MSSVFWKDKKKNCVTLDTASAFTYEACSICFCTRGMKQSWKPAFYFWTGRGHAEWLQRDKNLKLDKMAQLFGPSYILSDLAYFQVTSGWTSVGSHKLHAHFNPCPLLAAPLHQPVWQTAKWCHSWLNPIFSRRPQAYFWLVAGGADVLSYSWRFCTVYRSHESLTHHILPLLSRHVGQKNMTKALLLLKRWYYF